MKSMTINFRNTLNSFIKFVYEGVNIENEHLRNQDSQNSNFSKETALEINEENNPKNQNGELTSKNNECCFKHFF
jgi:hypothetical protein